MTILHFYWDSHLISSDSYRRLKACYPNQGFIKKIEQPGNPNQDNIRYANLDFMECTQDIFKILDPIWHEFYNAICSEEYLSRLSQITEMDLSPNEINLWFMRYHPNGFLSQHYDRQPKKILSQIFYFNDDWTSAEGGFFDFLTSSAPRKTIFSGLPDAIYSYIVKYTPNAWHEVKPVTGQRIRQTVNIEYYNR